ncbi:MAG: prepilin peptidase [Phycisphaerae bacterium]|nr:prepilin peptidase [Phycisphaerae bacterium]
MNAGIVILLAALIAASVTDIARQRIPNAITLPLAAFGILYNFYVSGWGGLIFSVTGTLAGVVLLIIFYLMGGMGAGDVKLMGAVGSILGPVNVLYAFVFCALLGGIYSLVVLYRHSMLRLSLERCVSALVDFLRTGCWFWFPSPAAKKLPRLRYAIAISLGTGIHVLRSLYNG